MSQITMLVVDDEYMILEGMKRLLPYDEFGIKIIKTAENAEQALAYFENHAVDIVLTDVCMPDMTGLEMINQMKKISNKTSYVMMSGYQEFDYVKKAISLGVKDYLVKPINKVELAQLLKELVKDKDTEVKLWQQVIKGLEPIQTLLNSQEELYLIATTRPLNGFESVDYYLNHQTIYMTFSSDPSECDVLFQELLDKDSQMSEILDRIERQLFYGNLSAKNDIGTHSYYEQLLPILESGQITKLREELIAIVEELSKETPAVYLSKQLFNQMMTTLYHHFPQLNHQQLEDYHLSVESSSAIEELLRKTLNHLEKIGESKKYSHHVEEILQIINKEYQSELNLKEVSERLYLNTVYLGQIIKKETGATFAELLNQKRIKVAKQILLTKDASIEEICFQVGYTNLGYFYKIFKRICGESPKSYRQKLDYLQESQTVDKG